MTINSGYNRPDQWQSPEHVDSWLANRAKAMKLQDARRRLVSLLPFQPGDVIRVLDIGTGDGSLGLEVLTAYPQAQLVCHDYSETMLARARQRLAQFKPLVSFVKSDLKDPEWTNVIEGHFNAVVSSIAIHNIAESMDSGCERIRSVYAEIFGLLKSGGCFLNFEYISPPGTVTEEIYLKRQFDYYQARPKSEARAESSLQEVEARLRAHLRHPKASLFDQLDWLKQAQYDEVDCLWKDIQSTIIGGFKH